MLSIVLHSPWSIPNLYSDLTDSFWTRCWVQSGSLPYLGSSPTCDHAFEYPVLSGLILYSVRAVGPDLMTFYAAFSGLSLLAGFVSGWACWSIARRLGRDLNAMFFLLPSFMIYGVYNFDLFHVMFVLLSILSFLRGKGGVSAVFLGLAVDTKLTSVVLLPVFLMELKGRRERLGYVGAFVLVIAAFNLPFAALGFKSFLEGYQFIGSYGLEDAWYVWIFQNPNSWIYAKLFGIVVSGLLLLRVYTLKTSLVAKSILAIAAYLLGTYIYSPQFNILLIPLLALLDLQHPSVFPWDGFNALIILTWFIQPNPTLPGSWPQFFALLRAICLAWLCLAVSSREGWSLTTWLRAMFGRPQGATNPLTPV